MKTFIYLIIMVFPVLLLGQTIEQFNAVFQIGGVSASASADYTLVGFFNDSRGLYSAADIAVGDIIWDAKCDMYEVSVIDQTTPFLQIQVNDINSVAPSTSVGVIFRPTINYDYPLISVGISESLRSCIFNHAMIEIDEDLNAGGGGGSDDQNIQGSGLNGTDLTIGIENGNSQVVDLSPLAGGGGTDDQTLSISGRDIIIESGNTITLPADNDTQLSEAEVDAFADNNGYLKTEIDGSLSNELNISVNLNGTSLEITDAGGTLSEDLSSLQDGTGTDDQTASEVAVTPSGNLNSTDVQAALQEHQVDIDALGAGASDGVATGGSYDAPNDEIDVIVAAPGASFSIDVSGLAEDADIPTNTSDLTNDSGFLTTEVDGSTTNEAWTIVADDANTEQIDNDVVDFQGANGITTSYNPSNNRLTIDGAGVTGSDDQAISYEPSTDVITLEDGGTIDITEVDTKLTEGEVDAFVSDNGYLTSEVDGSTSNELNTNLTLSGTTLQLTDPGGTLNQDLSSLQDGVGTDDQNISGSGLSGTNLTIGIEGGANEVVDLSGLQDGTGTDDQTASEVSVSPTGNLNSVDVQAALEEHQADIDALASGGGDGVATSGVYDAANDEIDLTVAAPGSSFSIDVSTLAEDGDIPTNVSELANDAGYITTEVDGNIGNEYNTDVTLTGTTLNVIDGGGSESVDLAPLQDGTGTDNQNINGSSFNSGTGQLTIGIESGDNESISLDGRYIQTEVDGSVTNEAWTIIADNAASEQVDNDIIDFQGANGITTSYNTTNNRLTIDGAGVSGTDNQTIDVLSLSGSTLNISLEGDGEVNQTVDLSPIDTDTNLSQEEVQDFIGPMVSGNTETNISVTYDDANNELDFVVTDGTSVTDLLNGLDISESSDNITISPDFDELGTESVPADGDLLILRDISGGDYNKVTVDNLRDGTGTDDQNISGSSFNSGTGNLTIGIENGANQSINIDGRYIQSEVDGSTTNEAWTIVADDANSEQIDNDVIDFEGSGGITTSYNTTNNKLTIDGSAITGTDDQNLTIDPGTATTSIINIEGGTDVTLEEGSGIELTESGNTITISSSGGGTDDQTALEVSTSITGADNISDNNNVQGALIELDSAIGSAIGFVENIDFAKRSSTSNINISSTGQAIPWQTSIKDGTDITWSSNDNTRLTVQDDGVYEIGGFFTIVEASDQRAQHSVEIYINGVATGEKRSSSYIRNSGASWDYWVLEMSNTPIELISGDFIEIFVGLNNQASYEWSGSTTSLLDGDKSQVWIKKMVIGTPTGGQSNTTSQAISSNKDTLFQTNTDGSVDTSILYNPGSDMGYLKDYWIKDFINPVSMPTSNGLVSGNLTRTNCKRYNGKYDRLYILHQSIVSNKREARIFWYDFDKEDFSSTSYKIGDASSNTDTHNIYTIEIDPNGHIIIIHTNDDSDVKVYRSDYAELDNFGSIDVSYSLQTNSLSLTNYGNYGSGTYMGNKLVINWRGNKESGNNQENRMIVSSDDHGVTFDTPIEWLELDNNHWAYGTIFPDKYRDGIFLTISVREGSSGGYPKWGIVWTDDLVTFGNMEYYATNKKSG